jgi:hypothetical protein
VEQNTLTLEQVRAVLEGKFVLGTPGKTLGKTPGKTPERFLICCAKPVGSCASAPPRAGAGR